MIPRPLCLLPWLWLLGGVGGCAPEGPTGASRWTAPTWSGDGLPTDTATGGGGSQDGRGGDSGDGDDSGQGGSQGGGEEAALDALYLVDGVFGVYLESTGATGYLVLSTEPVQCAEIMNYDAFPYGVYVLLEGPSGASETQGWEGTYAGCGSPPCLRDGFWQSATASGDLSEEEQIVILNAEAHFLEVTWSFGLNGADPLRIDNCQDADAW